MTRKTELVRFWVEEVWSKDNDKILDDMFSPDTTATGPVSDVAGKDFRSTDIVSALKALFQCPPELTFTVLEELGDWVITCFTVAVKDHPHRPPFDFDGQMVFRITDGKITEVHSNLNYIKMFEGLGQMPEDTLLVALTGAELDWK
ncbi:nuclear transport factor 2 family protein [Phycobacter azelaicus]|uniref:nuclear transport factor 2 family protein n=1 Tax=Phycobacter azelaicus TaxID=2668075 RepID=UPI0018670BB6